LVKKFEENGKHPHDYFEFVCHPTSFAKTVENMFHVSFLIKEGYARLFMDDSQLPALEPTEKALNPNYVPTASQQSAGNSNQVIMSIEMDEWEQIVKTFEIGEPMIKDKKSKDK